MCAKAGWILMVLSAALIDRSTTLQGIWVGLDWDPLLLNWVGMHRLNRDVDGTIARRIVRRAFVRHRYTARVRASCCAGLLVVLLKGGC